MLMEEVSRNSLKGLSSSNKPELITALLLAGVNDTNTLLKDSLQQICLKLNLTKNKSLNKYDLVDLLAAYVSVKT
jgi:hypothetical protein